MGKAQPVVGAVELYNNSASGRIDRVQSKPHPSRRKRRGDQDGAPSGFFLHGFSALAEEGWDVKVFLLEVGDHGIAHDVNGA